MPSWILLYPLGKFRNFFKRYSCQSSVLNDMCPATKYCFYAIRSFQRSKLTISKEPGKIFNNHSKTKRNYKFGFSKRKKKPQLNVWFRLLL